MTVGVSTAGTDRTGAAAFFVLNLESADPKADIPTIRMQILKDILAQLGFLKGIR